MKSQVLVKNRRASHDYTLLDTYEAGIALIGSEVKSLRNHAASLQDAYVQAKGGEIWLMSASISPYAQAKHFGHEEKRPRKLLMHKQEILRLERQVKEKGITIIPLSLFLKQGKVKLSLATAKGKKLYDKRAALKEKSDKKAIQKALKENI